MPWPSQLVKCAFGFSNFNDPKTKCVPLSVELRSDQGGTYSRCPPHVAGPGHCSFIYIYKMIRLILSVCVGTNRDTEPISKILFAND